jgi:hypothetical protein
MLIEKAQTIYNNASFAATPVYAAMILSFEASSGIRGAAGLRAHISKTSAMLQRKKT